MMLSVLSLGLLILLSVIFSFGMGIVMIVGGLKMMRLQSHGWAMTASILALLPCSPAGLVGLVVGIWSLIVLSRPHVKAAFQHNGLRGQLPVPPSATRRGPIGFSIALVALLVVLVAIGMSAVIFGYLRLDGESSNEATLSPPMAPHELSLDQASSTGWTMGTNGPKLTDAFARLSLKLSASQTESVNKVLQASYAEFPAIESQHTEQSTNDAGHIVVQIKPFPGPVAKLEDRLWSKLDEILDPEQQSIARRNLSLDPPEERPPIAVSDLVRPGFFGWGKNGAAIEIWRVGSWYHWKVATRGFDHSSSGPQLPEEYRRFWKEPMAASTEATKGEH
jgi:hypothetical protein